MEALVGFVGICVGLILLNAFLKGVNEGIERHKAQELVRQHPQHAVEIMKAMQPTPGGRRRKRNGGRL
jgi:hypothetical protein